MRNQAENTASCGQDGGPVRTVKSLSGVLLASVLLLAAVLLEGCATTNPVVRFYRDQPAGVDSAGVAAPFVSYSGTTRLLASTNLEGDGVNLTRDGYGMVGTFVYEGRDPVTAAQIIAQGEKVRADLVLYQRRRGILRAAVAITDDAEPPPTPHPSGAPNAGTHEYGATTVTTTHQRDAVPNRPGTFSTSMVPRVRLPVHEATFWRKRMTTSKP